MDGWMLAALVPPCCSMGGGALRAQIGPGRVGGGLVMPCCCIRTATATVPESRASRTMAVGVVPSRVAPVLLLLSPRASLSILLASWW